MTDTTEDLSTVPPGEARHLVRWYRLSIRFRLTPRIDLDELYAAIEPIEEAVDNLPPKYHEAEDSWERRLIAWGFYPHWSPESRRLIDLGMYGDYTWIEHDALFMPRIAPYVLPGSIGIFEVSRSPDRTDFWERDFEGWDFTGTRVRRRPMERIVDYEWTG